MKNSQNNRARIIAITILIFCLALTSIGCESIAKKFRRKKKEPVKIPRVYQTKEYARKPAAELYRKHYAYWASWQSELLKVMGANRKKDTRCIDEIIGNLRDMQDLLVKEKADELGPHIDRLIKVKGVIVNEELDAINKDYVRMTLEREDRYIRREFVYSKVKDKLKKGQDDAGEESK